jgi:nitrogenase subunit NifH
VQLVFSWNNKALQDNASTVDFRVNSVAETSWTCTKVVVQGNDVTRDIVQQRSTTTTIAGLVTTVARENSKGRDGAVTGFYLTGYEGTPVVGTDGPAPGSCPASPSGFVYDGNARCTGIRDGPS